MSSLHPANKAITKISVSIILKFIVLSLIDKNRSCNLEIGLPSRTLNEVRIAQHLILADWPQIILYQEISVEDIFDLVEIFGIACIDIPPTDWSIEVITC